MSTTRYCQAGHRFDIDGTMAVGETITVSVTPAQGYQFVSWSDGNTENPRQIYIDSCGEVYTARFTSVSPGPTPPTPEGPYTITVNTCPSGAGATNGGGTFEAGSTTTISVTPNSGFTFQQWDDGSTDMTRTVTVNSNKIYTARFEGCCDGYNWVITVPKTCFGTVSPETACVASHGSITIEFTPGSNYEFYKYVKTNGENTHHWTENPTTFTNVNEGRALTVMVRALIRTSTNGHGTVTQNPIPGDNGAGLGTVDSNHIGHYSKGQRFKLTANANSGYQFDHWELNNSTIQGENPLERTFDNNTCIGGTYKAVFTQNQPTQTTYYWKSSNNFSDLQGPISTYKQETYTTLPTVLDLGTYSTDGRFKKYTALIIPNGHSVSGIAKDVNGGSYDLTISSSYGCFATDVPSGYTCFGGSIPNDDTVGYSLAKFTIE